MATSLFVGIIGAVISAVTGTLWYSGGTPMGKWHLQYLGFDKLSDEEKKKRMAEAKPRMWRQYSAQLGLSFLTSCFIGFVTSYTVKSGGPASAVYFYVPSIWLAFTVPMIGQNLLWGNCEPGLARKKFFSDSLYNLLTYMVIAFVATLMV